MTCIALPIFCISCEQNSAAHVQNASEYLFFKAILEGADEYPPPGWGGPAGGEGLFSAIAGMNGRRKGVSPWPVGARPPRRAPLRSLAVAVVWKDGFRICL